MPGLEGRAGSVRAIARRWALATVAACMLAGCIAPAASQADNAANYAAAVKADHPVGYWRLEDTSTTAKDEQGAHPGTITNATPNQPGPIITDAAMRFDGNGDINLGHDAALRPTGSWSVELWFRADASDATACGDNYPPGPECDLYSTHAFGFSIYMTPAGKLGAFVCASGMPGGDSSGCRTAVTPDAADDDQWHHLVVVRDGSGLTLFVDAVQKATVATPAGTTYYCCEDISTIANDDACGCFGMHGYESEVALYNTPLPASRIQAHYAAAGPRPAIVAKPPQVSVGNGTAKVTWNPSDYGGASPPAWLVTAIPVQSDLILNGIPFTTKAVSQTVPASACQAGSCSAQFTGLVEDCHQQYTFTVAAQQSAGRSSTPSAPLRPSGILTGQPPPVVAILIDGAGGSGTKTGGTYDPLNPQTQGGPSYCPETPSSNAAAAQAATSPIAALSASNGLFASWNLDPQPYAYPANTTNTHHYLTDALAAGGGVLLTYSYKPPGALLAPSGHAFTMTGYAGVDTTDSTPDADVGLLDAEINSVHAAWPHTAIVVIGHSFGGLLAEQWWEAHYFQRGDHSGVTHVFSLDSPINGVRNAVVCGVLDAGLGVSGCPGGYGQALVSKFADLWSGIATRDPQVASEDDGSLTTFGTAGDPAYGYLTEGLVPTADLVSQLLMDSCTTIPLTLCSEAPPNTSIETSCPVGNLTAQQQSAIASGHYEVKICPDVVDTIAFLAGSANGAPGVGGFFGQVIATLQASGLLKILAQGGTGNTIASGVPGAVNVAIYRPGGGRSARVRKHARRRPRALARGTARFTTPGRKRVRVRLTPLGRRTLRAAVRAHRSLALIVSVSFTPTHGRATSTRLRITVRARPAPRPKPTQIVRLRRP